MAEKASKAKAHYRDGSKSRHCGLCTMFRKPHGCTAVKGKIDRDKLCDYFARDSASAERRAALYG